MKKEVLIKYYPIDWSPDKIQRFRKTLLSWYDTHGRDLPWRRTKNPYHIWVSEIMLQQTQVQTVIPYYERFISELPTIEALSQAEETQLMSLWQGLGYYSRVRNMQTAAQQMVDKHDGLMPDTMVELLALKGIGPYTAGAIGSIAFGLVEPALDGNLMRIVARMFEIDQDISLSSTKKIFMSILYQLIDHKRPGDFNQALMDIGATIMTPSNTYPENSPLKEFDQSFLKQTGHLYPVKKKKVKQTEHHWLAYAIFNQKGEWLMRRHTENELLEGLWHFPLVESEVIMEGATLSELIEPFYNQYGSSIDEEKFTSESKLLIQPSYKELFPTLPQVKHVFSHRKWLVQLIPIMVNDSNIAVEDTLQWVHRSNLIDYPLSTLQQKLFKQIDINRN